MTHYEPETAGDYRAFAPQAAHAASEVGQDEPPRKETDPNEGMGAFVVPLVGGFVAFVWALVILELWQRENLD